MKERPIIMSGASVRAILAGTKTQTRRAIKLNDSGRAFLGHRNWHLEDPNATQACPYGQSGDRLWVRETWRVAACYNATPPQALNLGRRNIEFRAGERWLAEPERGRWRSPLHMPRRACRLVLEIEDVRVQRVQDITETDAEAEGYEWLSVFAAEWSRLNGKRGYPWTANPWVWAISFRRVDPC